MGNKRNHKKRVIVNVMTMLIGKNKNSKNRAKRARVVETEERIEDIRTDLHDTIDEMEIQNRVQE